MAEPGAGRRRTFGPVVLLGLVAAGLAAVAGDKPAAAAGGKAADAASGNLALTFDAHLPVVTALGLVVLACWGVVLVTRGRVRRAVAALAVLAGLGALAAVVVAFSQVPDQLRDELTAIGISDPDVGRTGWYWAAGAGAVLAVVASVLAVAWAPDWPEMGSRYDAPGATAPAAPVDPEDQSSLDLWKAMDEGRDPTARPPE